MTEVNNPVPEKPEPSVDVVAELLKIGSNKDAESMLVGMRMRDEIDYHTYENMMHAASYQGSEASAKASRGIRVEKGIGSTIVGFFRRK